MLWRKKAETASELMRDVAAGADDDDGDDGNVVCCTSCVIRLQAAMSTAWILSADVTSKKNPVVKLRWEIKQRCRGIW